MEGYNFLILLLVKKRDQTSKIFKNYTLVDENLNFEQQLNLINQLPAFISMDSANMHLASLTNTSNFHLGTNSSLYWFWTIK